ncbi:MAG: NAD(P)-dependent oxidoreductase, partial [Parafilimonas terrae]|nr:NAD(P)-dependent oxidoreductase [Parafilimonas terrae]
MPTRIALLGLGAMGHPIARNLAAKRGSEAETIVAVDADPARL